MEVFLLKYCIEYEGSLMIGAFSTKEKAQSYLNQTSHKKDRKNYEIETLVVDELEKSDKMV